MWDSAGPRGIGVGVREPRELTAAWTGTSVPGRGTTPVRHASRSENRAGKLRVASALEGTAGNTWGHFECCHSEGHGPGVDGGQGGY